MALIETWLNSDLGNPVQVKYLNGNLFSQDNQANLIGVRVYESGDPASLAGSVSANVIRADGSTVAVAGTLQNSNECYVILPQTAYAVSGAISVIIKLTSGSQVTTLAAVISTVYTSSTDTVVDPGTIIPDIQALIAEIETAIASIPADYTSLWTSLAPAFNPSKSGGYKAREYVTYNGGVYKFKNDHSGSWSSSDVDAVDIGSELTKLQQADSELKSALYADIFASYKAPIDFINPSGDDFAVVSGGIKADGTDSTQASRAKTSFFTVKPGCGYLFSLDDTDYYIVNAFGYSSADASTMIRRVTLLDDNHFIVRADSTMTCLRVSFGKSADHSASMGSSDRAAVKTAIKLYFYTDGQLVTEGSPADAKATGDKFDEIINAIGNINATPLNWAKLYGTEEYPKGWTTGYYKSSDGTKTASNHYIRSMNRKISFADYVMMVLDPPSGYFIDAFEYNQDKTYTNVHTRVYNKTIIPTNGHKFNFYVGRFDNNDSEDYLTDAFISQIKVTLIGSNETGTKKPRTGDYEFFSVTVDRPVSFGGEEVITTQEEVECVLRLPESYRMSGKPTQLILACHGASGYINASTNTWYNSNWKAFMDALLSAGYAVFDSNVLPTSTGTDLMGRAVGSPLYVNVLKKAYDYIQQNYNVTEKIFAHGTSMGGCGATDFANAYPSIVLAQSSFAGRDITLYIHHLYYTLYPETGKTQITNPDDFAVAFGYEGLDSLVADKWSHIEGLCPALHLKKYADGQITLPPDRETDFTNWLIYFRDLYEMGRSDSIGDCGAWRIVPYKGWDSWGDNIADTKANLMLQKAFRTDGNAPYEVVIYENATHTELSYGQISDMRDQLIAWYKRWDYYSYYEDNDDD